MSDQKQCANCGDTPAPKHIELFMGYGNRPSDWADVCVACHKRCKKNPLSVWGGIFKRREILKANAVAP